MPAPPEPIDLLVAADFLYPMTEGLPVIAGGEVAIKDGRILHAGAARARGSWAPAETLGGAGKAVLPGFVNCHSHLEITPMRGALDRQEELDRVLAHEFTHALIRSLAPRNVPTWINEGIAAALERESLDWASDLVKKAGGPAPLAALTRSFGRLSGQQAELAYATSALAARSLLDANGGVAMSNLLRDLGHGEPIAPAFEHRMNESLEQFSARFRSTY